jgi:DNA-binding response OmpR family regulator
VFDVAGECRKCFILLLMKPTSKKNPASKIPGTIMLIDDDSDEHVLFSNALEKFNSNITCLLAYNCSEGYYMAKTKTPDIIFLDLNLPGTNGIACLRKIKKMPVLQNIPVYMYSGGVIDQKEVVTALEAGAKKWIKKPKKLEEYELIFSQFIN